MSPNSGNHADKSKGVYREVKSEWHKGMQTFTRMVEDDRGIRKLQKAFIVKNRYMGNRFVMITRFIIP